MGGPTAASEPPTRRASYALPPSICVDIPRYLSLYRRGLLPLDGMITETIGLDELVAGFAASRESTGIRSLVTMDEK